MLTKLQRKSFVGCLIDLALLALNKKLYDEAAGLTTGLRVLKPGMRELDLLDAFLFNSRRQHRDALRLLVPLEDHPHVGPYAKALMAACQRLLGDAGWQQTAESVLAGSGPEGARQMAAAVLSKTGKLSETDAAAEAGESCPGSEVPSFQPSYPDAVLLVRA